MENELICVPCERGEHGTILNDLAGRLMRCDCNCHRRASTHPVDPLLPRSSTQSVKALVLMDENPTLGSWWLQVFTKAMNAVFSPKERV